MELKEMRFTLGATLNLGDYENVRSEVSALFLAADGETPEQIAAQVAPALHGALVDAAKLLIADQPALKQARLLASIGAKAQAPGEPPRPTELVEFESSENEPPTYNFDVDDDDFDDDDFDDGEDDDDFDDEDDDE